jgi:Holliday junction DNA helicase RuvA
MRDEALSALLMLGFPRNVSEKALDKLLSEKAGMTAEELVKQALKQL